MDTAPALDDRICFALYSASRAITAAYRPLLDALELTYPQYLVMLRLWDAGPATVGTLGDQLQLDSGTLSPLLKRLESHGLISRRRRPEDERSVEIRLTAKGSRLRHRAATIPEHICAATGLELGDLDALVGQLQQVTMNVRRTLTTR
jgi:DNA-binding MarR family transcriptional regulator